MKIRYPVIALIILLLIAAINENLLTVTDYYFLINDCIGILYIVCIGLIFYLIIRNIFRAIRNVIQNAGRKKEQQERQPWEK